IPPAGFGDPLQVGVPRRLDPSGEALRPRLDHIFWNQLDPLGLQPRLFEEAPVLLRPEETVPEVETLKVTAPSVLADHLVSYPKGEGGVAAPPELEEGPPAGLQRSADAEEDGTVVAD